jgi:hypothetical protein
LWYHRRRKAAATAALIANLRASKRERTVTNPTHPTPSTGPPGSAHRNRMTDLSAVPEAAEGVGTHGRTHQPGSSPDAASAEYGRASDPGSRAAAAKQEALVKQHAANAMHQPPEHAEALLTAEQQAALVAQHIPNTMYMSSESTAANPQVLVVQHVSHRARANGPDYYSSAGEGSYAGGIGPPNQAAIYTVPMEVDDVIQAAAAAPTNNTYHLAIPKARALRSGNAKAPGAMPTAHDASAPQRNNVHDKWGTGLRNNVYDKWGTGLPELSPAAVVATVYGSAAVYGTADGACATAASDSEYLTVEGAGRPTDDEYITVSDAVSAVASLGGAGRSIIPSAGGDGTHTDPRYAGYAPPGRNESNVAATNGNPVYSVYAGDPHPTQGPPAAGGAGPTFARSGSTFSTQSTLSAASYHSAGRYGAASGSNVYDAAEYTSGGAAGAAPAPTNGAPVYSVYAGSGATSSEVYGGPDYTEMAAPPTPTPAGAAALEIRQVYGTAYGDGTNDAVYEC